MIEIAKQKNAKNGYKNLSFQVGDAYDLSFDKNKFNKIVSCNVLQTMKNPFNAAEKSNNILGEGVMSI